MNTRACAATIVAKVLNEHLTLDQAMNEVNLACLNDVDKRFVHNLCYGTIRWYYRLKPLSEKLLHKPLQKKNQDVLAILLIGLYQLIYLGTPKHAAIYETVNATKVIKKKWASGLINKTLRIFLDKETILLSSIDKNMATKYALPEWLAKQIVLDWGDQAFKIFQAINTEPPMTLRVNAQLTSKEAYIALLKEHGIEATSIPSLPYAIRLNTPVSVDKLPMFDQGFCYVQDESGQHTPRLLHLKAEQRVLDACAAPGSKMTDILSTQPNLKKLVAVDKDPKRIKKIDENIKRLKIKTGNVQLVCADIGELKTWWDGEEFDRILLDAPCSATGVIRRHPEIKLLRRENDVYQQAKLQKEMLKKLWPLLKVGGLMLYATCSLMRIENSKNVEAFIKDTIDAQSYPQDYTSDQRQNCDWQLLPTKNSTDGFYYATIQKVQLKNRK